MPVDVEPLTGDSALGGDIVLTLHGGEWGELRAEKYHSQVHGLERRRFTSHFATCKHAAQHRKKDAP